MEGTFKKPSVVIVRGGTTQSARKASMASGSAAYHTLRGDYNVSDIHLTSSGNYELDGRRVDIIHFLNNFDGVVFHTLEGRDATRLQRICHKIKKPHTGNFYSRYGDASKFERRNILRKTGVKTIPYWRLVADYDSADITLYKSILNELRYPVVISPLPDAFSVDALVVRSEAELLDVVDTCFSLKAPVSVSDTYTGNLYAIVVMESFRGESPYAFPAYELLHTHEVANTYDADTTPHQPRNDLSTPNDVIDLAKSAFQDLHLRNIGRVDILESPDDELYVLDVNPHPALDRHSLVADAAQEVGSTMSEVLSAITHQAGSRISIKQSGTIRQKQPIG